MSAPSNNERADRVEYALNAYRNYLDGSEASSQENVTDILTDLRHYCDREKLCLGDFDRIAHRHYLWDLQGGAQ